MEQNNLKEIFDKVKEGQAKEEANMAGVADLFMDTVTATLKAPVQIIQGCVDYGIDLGSKEGSYENTEAHKITEKVSSVLTKPADIYNELPEKLTVMEASALGVDGEEVIKKGDEKVAGAAEGIKNADKAVNEFSDNLAQNTTDFLKNVEAVLDFLTNPNQHFDNRA